MMGQSFAQMDTTDYQTIDIPSSLTSIEYISDYYDRSANGTLEFPVSPAQSFDYSGNNTDKITVLWASYEPNQLLINRVWSGFWIFNNIEPIKPYPLPKATVIDAFNSETNSSVLYLQSPHKNYVLEFTFNSSFTNLTSAWNAGNMTLWIGEGDQVNPNTKGVWSLLTSIIFFDNPDIHPVINFVFAIPFYAMFVTIVYYVFSRFIEVVKPFG